MLARSIWPLGRPANATVRGQFSRSGYNVQVQGDAEVQRLLEVARTVGLPAPQPAATGEARSTFTWAAAGQDLLPPQLPGPLSCMRSARGFED